MAGKAQLVEAIAARGTTKAAAAAAVDAVLGEVAAALVAGERVTLTGFGTFEAVVRPARIARNPRTGASVEVPAATVVRFHPGAGLRTAVATGVAPERSALTLPGVSARAAVAAAVAADEPTPGTEAPAKPVKGAKPAAAKGKDAKGKKPEKGKKDAKDAKGKKDAKAKGAKGKKDSKGKGKKG